jgi:hypothetical protein
MAQILTAEGLPSRWGLPYTARRVQLYGAAGAAHPGHRSSMRTRPSRSSWARTSRIGNRLTATLMDTNMVRESVGRPWSSVAEGAAATLRLVTSPALDGVTGRYFDQQREARALDQAYDRTARNHQPEHFPH